jgi:hypothetical protein
MLTTKVCSTAAAAAAGSTTMDGREDEDDGHDRRTEAAPATHGYLSCLLCYVFLYMQ